MMLHKTASYAFDTSSKDKPEAFQQAARILLSRGFKLIDFDSLKPWGFYLSVDESQAKAFKDEFYGPDALPDLDFSLPLRPKFLGVAPGLRLSWQWHHRRSEIWRPIKGEFQVVLSKTDKEAQPRLVEQNQIVNIPQGMRHRGIGTENWALIAEIWRHTEPANPSNEDDIVRVQDDFGR